MKNNITLNNFNRNVPSLQLSMNFDVDVVIPEDGKVRLVCNIVESMNLSTVLSAYSSKGRKPVLDPITFLKVILFCYSEGIFHSRKIEASCKYDLRGHFILGGKKAPDHSTICRFEQLLADHTTDLLIEFVQLLHEDGHVDTVWTYTCYECENCPHAFECIKARKNSSPTQKSIQFSPAFEQHRMQSETNILTDVGIDHRINRSIQAEGAFSKLKDGLGYTRFRHRSMKKVVSDIVLVALGITLNKLHSKILNHQTEIIAYKKTA